MHVKDLLRAKEVLNVSHCCYFLKGQIGDLVKICIVVYSWHLLTAYYVLGIVFCIIFAITPRRFRSTNLPSVTELL